MRAVVATHGHCFDGLCSAVLFTRLLRALKGPAVRFHYLSCGYSPAQRPLDALLDGDVNAILDYRFCATDRLDWYFDHHRTAFGSDADQAFFEARRAAGSEGRSEQAYFYDASYSSCTKLVRDVALARYDIAMPELEPLTAWADKIDSAAFESAEAALDYSHPVMQLVSVVEHHGDGELLARLVPRLLEAPVEAVAKRSEFRELYRKIRRKKAAFAQRVQQNARHRGRVVLVDLSEAELETYGKFVTYALYPDAMYSVILGRFKNGARINVGYNPWSTRELDRDLSSICGRYGGGGHPFVGGISFPAEDAHRARDVAREIACELDG
jgi:hypothetical protein